MSLHLSKCHIAKALLSEPCADPEGGGGGVQGVRTPPEKSQKYRVSKQYWSGSPDKLQSYQATMSAFKVGQSLVRQRNTI